MYPWLRTFLNFNNRYLFISLYLTFLVVENWIKIQTIEINSFDHLIQGSGTFANTDINKRLSIFYISLLLLFVTFIFCVLLSFIIDKKLGRLSHLSVPWNILGVIGVAFIFFKIVKSEQPFSEEFLYSAFPTLLLFQITKYKFRIRLLNVTSISFVWLSAISFSSCFVLREGLHAFAGFQLCRINILYPILFTGLLGLLIVLSYLTRWSFRKIFLASLSFFAFPLLSVLSGEIYLILNQNNIHFLSPGIFYSISILVCLLVCIWLFHSKGISTRMNLKEYLQNRVYPLLLLGVIVFTQYKPFVSQSDDLFEPANPANAIMRMFDFHELPILQALSSHLLSDVSLKPIYILLNGYSGSIDFVIYDFIINSIFVLLFYFFFLRIFKNALFVFILAMFFPFLAFAILDHQSLVFGSIFLIAGLFDEYSFKKLLLLGFWSFFLMVWRIEVGVSSLVATTFLMGLYINKQYSKTLLIDLLKTGLILLGTVLLIAVSAWLILKVDIPGNFLQAKEYFGANQAHGLPDVTYNYDRFYHYHYIIFPVITLFVFIYLLFSENKERREKFGFLYSSLLFLIVFYFVQAQRGLVRHSMLEGSDVYMSSYFYLIIALFIYFLTANYKYARYIFICSLIFLIHNFEFPNSDGNKNSYEELSSVFQLPSQVQLLNHKVSRITGADDFAKKHYSDFKKFMDTCFTKDATFIDFSNSPMLYFYTKRKVPSYFNQYMQNTVTENLQQINLNYLKRFAIPVVVFSSVPETWWDCTDGVPNTIRYNKIASYIYKHYEPMTVLNGHYIWTSKEEKISVPDSIKIDLGFARMPKTYDLKKYPYVLARSEELMLDTVNYYIWNTADSGLKLNGRGREDKYDNYLLLEIINRNENNTEISVNYSVEGSNLGGFKLIAVPSVKEKLYAIPLSSQYNWIQQQADRITISGEQIKYIKIEKAYLFAKKSK
jgi:hypothetical protein